MCCDCNHDGKIDYVEFTERFHNPAKEIGFNLAVLLTNLSEHMPNDPRLARFLEVIILFISVISFPSLNLSLVKNKLRQEGILGRVERRQVHKENSCHT